jgi:hypothetical protein
MNVAILFLGVGVGMRGGGKEMKTYYILHQIVHLDGPILISQYFMLFKYLL